MDFWAPENQDYLSQKHDRLKDVKSPAIASPAKPESSLEDKQRPYCSSSMGCFVSMLIFIPGLRTKLPTITEESWKEIEHLGAFGKPLQ